MLLPRSKDCRSMFSCDKGDKSNASVNYRPFQEKTLVFFICFHTPLYIIDMHTPLCIIDMHTPLYIIDMHTPLATAQASILLDVDLVCPESSYYCILHCTS